MSSSKPPLLSRLVEGVAEAPPAFQVALLLLLWLSYTALSSYAAPGFPRDLLLFVLGCVAGASAPRPPLPC